jgi:hypothetical protein
MDDTTYLTILKRAWSANFKMVWYVLLRPLRPELDGRPSSENFNYSCTKIVVTNLLTALTRVVRTYQRG